MSTDSSSDRDASTRNGVPGPAVDRVRGAPSWREVLRGDVAPVADAAPSSRERARREARLEALPAWSASFLARRHAGSDGEPTGADAEGGRHRGTGRGARIPRRRRRALGDHRLVTAPTGPTVRPISPTTGATVPPWWWLLRPRTAARPAPVRTDAGPGAPGRRPPRRATLLLTSILTVAALLGPLVAAGPVGSSAAGALPPAEEGPLGATGALPDFFTSPDDPDDASVDTAGEGVAGIPAAMLVTYRRAEADLAGSAPSCRLGWALVAAIGKVESGHARGGALDDAGTTLTPILGPRLDGSGANAAIPDTDGGAYDGDTVWDRAVGPTQFIPSTWQAYGVDANEDGRADPNNAHDATTATGRYLCAGDTDLSDPRQLHDAVFRYNHSESYVRTVLSWARTYASGATAVPDATRPADPGTPAGTDPLTLAAASAALPGPNVPVPDSAGPRAAPAPGRSVSAASGTGPGTIAPHPPPTSDAVPTSPPTSPTPRSTATPAATTPVPTTPTTPTPTTPSRPPVPGSPSAPPSPAPETGPTSAEQACRVVTPAQVAEAFGLPPGTVSRSSDAAGCQFRGPGGLLLTIDITQGNQIPRKSDPPVVQFERGRQLVISIGGRTQLRLTVPGDAPMTPTPAQVGLGALAARLL